MSSAADTIVALATPPGRGGIAVVRVSGPAVAGIAGGIIGGLPHPRTARYGSFLAADGEPIDIGITLFFPAPHSFTGEDVLELQCHGGPIVSELLLARVVELGGRLANPGEFSARAFLNGKLDLAQAEAIADLIDSGTTQAARCAMRSLSGEFSRRVHDLTEALIALRTYCEAAIDFPEEEIDFLDDDNLQRRMGPLQERVEAVLLEAEQGRLLRDGMRIVLLGRPNAGKSSLLNRLSRSDRAIVSAVPGTTRDTLEQIIQLDGLPVHLIDTAGLRDTGDHIEREGVARARAALATADVAVVLVDDTDTQEIEPLVREVPTATRRVLVLNKIDLSGRAPGRTTWADCDAIALSAKTGAGLEELRRYLKECMGFQPVGESVFMARRRHLDALTSARDHLSAAQRHLLGSRAGELLAEELRLAQQALGQITGEFTSDDLLGEIFGSFCIGK